jgi:protein O-mannosyl-transferase
VTRSRRECAAQGRAEDVLAPRACEEESSAERPARERNAWRAWLAGLVLVVLTVALYAPVSRYGFTWDDDDNVTANENLRTVHGLLRTWTDPRAHQQYYPLTHTSFWLEYHAWALNPSGYHVVNVALHVASVLLLWRLLVRLDVPAAWVAAAVFAVHPVHVESVAWITERKNVLSLSLALAACNVCLIAFGVGSSPSSGFRSSRAWTSSLFLFAAALTAKTAIAPLPAALVALLRWRLPQLQRRDLAKLLPFFLLAVPFGLLTARLERNYTDVMPTVWNAGVGDKLLVAGRAAWFYPAKLVWPAELMFIYPRWSVNAFSAAQWLYPVAAIVVVIVALTRRRLPRGVLVAVVWYAVLIFPALGFFDVYFMQFSFVQDHFQYAASVGVLTLAVAFLEHVVRRLAPRPLQRPAWFLVAMMVLIVLATMTWKRLPEFRDAESMWRAALVHNPAAWIAHNNLGNLLRDQGREGEALVHYAAAADLNPPQGGVYFNLGLMLEHVGRLDEAREAYLSAVNRRPPFCDAYMNLALIDFNRGDYALARRATHGYEACGGNPDPAFVAALRERLGQLR